MRRRHASGLQGASEYSSFTYWRNPLPDLNDELAAFIKNRDAAAADKNGDVKKSGTAAAGKKAAAVPASTTTKTADLKSSSAK